MTREAKIAAVLSEIPGADVEATTQPDGSQIVIEVDGQTYRLSVGPGRSALVDYLLTGYVS
jgi:hypothetical protein